MATTNGDLISNQRSRVELPCAFGHPVFVRIILRMATAGRGCGLPQGFGGGAPLSHFLPRVDLRFTPLDMLTLDEHQNLSGFSARRHCARHR